MIASMNKEWLQFNVIVNRFCIEPSSLGSLQTITLYSINNILIYMRCHIKFWSSQPDKGCNYFCAISHQMNGWLQ